MPNVSIFSSILSYRKLVGMKLFPVFLNKSCKSYSSKEEKKKLISVVLQDIPIENIRNFSIIAHVDHGKSTLSDRLLELTDTIDKSEKNVQVLDKLQVERERGITVKAQTASMLYDLHGTLYLLNLIDTPGHVDFSYEVSRSLAACQGAILLIDANQGVQAQTVANFNLAINKSLKVIPVLNKIDLKNAKPVAVTNQLTHLFGITASEVLKVSAKVGTGCPELLEEIVYRFPSPSGSLDRPFRAFLFDSWYDKHRGCIIMVSVIDGCIKLGDEVLSSTNKKSYQVRDMGVLSPDEHKITQLKAGQAGFLVLNMKNVSEAKIGDTLHHRNTSIDLLPPVPAAKPMVFAGIFPIDQSQIELLRSSIEKLTLNDSSVQVNGDSSPALGQGWRLGFLGLLHMEVFCQRLINEYQIQVVVTAPSVPYKAKLLGAKRIKLHGGDEVFITNPLEFPDPTTVSEYLEPMVLATIISPSRYLETVTNLCVGRRGIEKSLENIDENNFILQYKFPLSEVILDFFDDLKSVSSGFASFDYEDIGYEKTAITRVNFILNNHPVEELSLIVHTSRVQTLARKVCQKLQSSIPRQQYEVVIQAILGKKVIARETIKAARKDVLAKCYGGDVTRKMKLLKNQAEGKNKMRMCGNIQVPRDAFIQVLKK